MQSAASAKRGDIVRLIGTDVVGVVAKALDDGRIWVTLDPPAAPATEKWERYAAEVLSTIDTDRGSL